MSVSFPVIIAGTSGVGKTTLCRYILERLPNVKYSVSATTRKPRDDEVNGTDYYFLSREQFYEWKKAGKFCECAEVYGELYGTPKSPLVRYLNEGYHVLLAIDVQGARAIKYEYPSAVSIFLLPPSIYELKNRLVNRNKDSDIEINKRLRAAKLETSCIGEFDYVVVNDKVEVAGKKIIAIITAEECKQSRFTMLESFQRTT